MLFSLTSGIASIAYCHWIWPTFLVNASQQMAAPIFQDGTPLTLFEDAVNVIIYMHIDIGMSESLKALRACNTLYSYPFVGSPISADSLEADH